MRLACFYDTETTGLPLFREPSEDPRQPHVVQLAAALVDLDARKIVSQFDLTVRPDGWTIPDDVAKIHGITTERALRTGVAESKAVKLLVEMADQAEFRVAHNEQFDARIIRIALMRHANIDDADVWKDGKADCTATRSTPVLKLPPTEKMVRAGFNKPKTPNLGEAYKHFTGKDLEGAHSALVDVKACIAVWFGLEDAAA